MKKAPGLGLRQCSRVSSKSTVSRNKRTRQIDVHCRHQHFPSLIIVLVLVCKELKSCRNERLAVERHEEAKAQRAAEEAKRAAEEAQGAAEEAQRADEEAQGALRKAIETRETAQSVRERTEHALADGADKLSEAQTAYRKVRTGRGKHNDHLVVQGHHHSFRQYSRDRLSRDVHDL